MGTFTTAPSSAAAPTLQFAVSGDADATPGPNGKPGFNRFEVYARMAAEDNDFNINLGDTIYSDSEISGAPVARTVAEKWVKYKLGLALPRAPEATRIGRSLQPLGRPRVRQRLLASRRTATRSMPRASRLHATTRPSRSRAAGLYRTFRWGKNLELFFLDERSFRSAKATAVCNGDLAPTAPQPVRDGFAALAPGLRNPVPPACLAAIDDPARTMLGARSTPRSRRRSRRRKPPGR